MKKYLEYFFMILFSIGLFIIISSFWIGVAYFIYEMVKTDLGFWHILSDSLETFIEVFIVGVILSTFSYLSLNNINQSL